MAKRRGRRLKSRKARRGQAVETMAFTGPLAGIDATSTTTFYLNAAYVMSNINRKAFHQVTRSGHLKTYGVGISVFNCKNASTAIYTAPNNYVTENAVRAWHFTRKERYADAGFSLGNLGHGNRMRFALDPTSAALDQTTATEWLKPLHLDNTVAERGEWDLSDVVITPPVDISSSASHSITVGDATDSFKLHICGDHTVDTTESDETIQYTLVGMNQSWVENRRAWAVPAAEQVIQPENPLAFARMSEFSSMAVVEEVSDEQKQQPPYSIDDDDDAESVFASIVLSGQLESSFPNVTTNNDLVVCPGGLAKIAITNNDAAAAYPYLSMQLIELS